jgi:16S rRNA (guanine1516-N2)-methyltransferase
MWRLPHIDGVAAGLVKPREIATYLRARASTVEGGAGFVFLLTEAGLSLAQVSSDGLLSVRADFYGPTVRYRREKGGGRGQMISKAAGIGSATGEPIRLLDATAGLGGDAFVLASLGAEVTMMERVPEVRALLRDGLVQAAEWGRTHDPELLPILGRMRLEEAEAVGFMQSLDVEQAPDVIYLDPMFPPRNKSALVKKEMRVFHDLVGSDTDAAALLPVARQCARRRVVVKRPRHAPTLTAESPSYALAGKRNRFDVYVCP